MKKSKKAIVVGGGTGGHIIPAVVVAKALKNKGYSVVWIGSKKSYELEEKLIRFSFPDIKIYHIPSGKLRRSGSTLRTLIDLRNIADIFAFISGIFVSFFILLKEKPLFVFSKGGFVSVPVAISCKMTKVPFFTHESDYTVGLANKINLKFSKKFFYSFEDTLKYLPENKAIFSSNPVREVFFSNNKDEGLKRSDKITNSLPLFDEKVKDFFLDSDLNSKLILILGGSLGSQRINNIIFKLAPILTQKYLIIHQTGKLNDLNLNFNSGKEEKMNQSNSNKYFKFNPFGLKGYLQIEFIYNGIAELMKLSDLIISRAGANLVFEIVASKTPAIFIPLKTASRGEQENNARYFAKKGNYIVLDEEKLDDKILFNEIEKIFDSQILIKGSQLDSQVATININSLIKAEDIIISSIEKELKINS